MKDAYRAIPTTFSVPRRTIEAFRAVIAHEGKESASAVVTRLLDDYLATRRNGKRRTA
jgi:hypothetical protein